MKTAMQKARRKSLIAKLVGIPAIAAIIFAVGAGIHYLLAHL